MPSSEKRERDLRELVRKNKRPVVLFVDEAHDLNGHTLTGLKRLVELVEDGQGRLSVVLAGYPKLRKDLRRPTTEEIGNRPTCFRWTVSPTASATRASWTATSARHFSLVPRFLNGTDCCLMPRRIALFRPWRTWVRAASMNSR